MALLGHDCSRMLIQTLCLDERFVMVAKEVYGCFLATSVFVRLGPQPAIGVWKSQEALVSREAFIDKAPMGLKGSPGDCPPF